MPLQVVSEDSLLAGNRQGIAYLLHELDVGGGKIREHVPFVQDHPRAFIRPHNLGEVSAIRCTVNLTAACLRQKPYAGGPLVDFEILYSQTRTH